MSSVSLLLSLVFAPLACASVPPDDPAAELRVFARLAELSQQDPAQAQALPPLLRLPRLPALSPDGERVAFGHQGDVWLAGVNGGLALRLTANDAYDGSPKFSPDGKWLAFASRRHGNFDLYIMPAAGGTPERITFHSGDENLVGWLDNDRLLFSAIGDRYYSRRGTGLWVAYRDGRTPTILGDFACQRPAISPDGTMVCYERGHGDLRRRAYRGAASSALWLFDPSTGEHTQLTSFDGNDLNPMWSADGQSIYFLSDRECANNEKGRELGLWRVRRSGDDPVLLYHPGDASLRSGEIARNRDWIVCELRDGMVMVNADTAEARAIPVRGSYDPLEPEEMEVTVKGGAGDLAVSPDGESIAFVSGGDVYVLRKHDKIKRAARVTTDPAPDYNPVWVEDGEALLFVSERDGNGEVYRVRTSPPSPSGDGLDASSRSDESDVRVPAPPAPQSGAQNGRALAPASGAQGEPDAEAGVVADQAPEDEAEEEPGEDSEDDDEEEPTPFYKSHTFYEERLTNTPEDESDLRLSPDSHHLAWVIGAGKLVVGDPDTLEAARTIIDGFDHPDYRWSPDSAWIAFSKVDNDYNSEVYVARALPEDDYEGPGKQPFNLTRHPDDDTGPRWSPDGRKLAFTSRRQMLDETDVYVCWLAKEEAEMTERERLEAEETLKKQKEKEKKAKAKAKSKAKKDAGGKDEPAAAEDDGLSGTWEGTLTGEMFGDQEVPMTLEMRMAEGGSLSGSVTTPMGSATITSGSYDEATGALAVSLEADDGSRIEVSGTISGSTLEFTGEVPAVGASVQGKLERAKPYLGQEEGGDDADGDKDKEEEEEEEVEPVVIDFEDIHLRLNRVTRREGNEEALGFDADSEKIYFNASVGTRLSTSVDGEEGFFEIGVRGKDEEKLEPAEVNSFTTHKKAIFYAKGGQVTGREGKATTYPFSVSFRQSRKALREAVLDQAWRALDRNFYDPNFHGHDWSASRAKWKPLALAASTSEDYGLMMNYMLGEMNASHMGYYGAGTTEPKEVDDNTTAVLGVLWDESHAGPGRRVREVLKDMPAYRELSRLEPGDVVLAVNGTEYNEGENWARLMLGLANEEAFLTVQNPAGEEREVRIRPASYFAMGEALYRHWTEKNRAEVEERSDGKLGYIHIEGMGTGSLLEFERDLFNAGEGKEGLLIDVRENGGGWTTDMVLAMLMVKNHAITIPRGGGPGYPQERRIFAAWDKPVVVLCNEDSYSNAEIFSWSIRTLKRGPVVGKQTYGAVISTGGTGLLDGSFVRLPLRGWYVNDGTMTNMEHNGCPPDYPVENLPGDFVAGKDRQLEKAVEVGLELVTTP